MRVILAIHSGAGIGDVVALIGCAQSLVEDHGAEVHVQCRPKGWDCCSHNPFVTGFDWPVERKPGDVVVDTAQTNTELRFWGTKPDEPVCLKSRTEFMAEYCAHVFGLPVRPTCPVYRVTQEEAAWARAWFAEHKVDPKNAVGIQPCATKHWRTWPRPLGLSLCRALNGQGRSCIVFHHRILEVSTYPAHLFIADKFWKVGAALSLLRLFVGVDSGLFHVASAAGIPAIGLFGATSGEALSRSYPKATFIQGAATGHPTGAGRTCAGPCHKQYRRGFYKQQCWYVGCEAMWDITPDKVLAEIERRWEEA